jgi:hypothetical protein
MRKIKCAPRLLKAKSLVPQVRVPLLDANLGRGTFGTPSEHSPMSTHRPITIAAMYFEVVGTIKQVEVIAAGLGVRERRRLWKAYGRGSWRKLKGIARIKLRTGARVTAELHW